MPHAFELRLEIEVHASPEAIWEAIATGPGIDRWFIADGNEVEPGPDGRVSIGFGGGASSAHPITTWDPPRSFAHGGEPGPDGTAHAMAFEIEGRAGGRTLVRLVHSGFLADDWEAEYEALREGDFVYLHWLAQYVEHFRGRPVTFVAAMRPEVDRARGLETLLGTLGLPADVREGAPVRASLDGVGPIEGVVDLARPDVLGVRTADALYRFTFPMGMVYVGLRIYRDGVDGKALTAAWQGWVDQTFGRVGAPTA